MQKFKILHQPFLKERVFSTGGNIVTAKRCRLGPRRVEQLIVIKENLSKVKEFELLYTDDYQIEALDVNPFSKIKTHVSQMNTTGEIVEVVEVASSDEEDDFLDDADWVGSVISDDTD